jgi:hypothetical protein
MCSSNHRQAGDQTEVPSWLWWSVIASLIIVLVTGLGLVAALALGWRSPTPRRSPDWEQADIQWVAYGEGSTTTSPDGYRMRLSQPEQRGWAVGGPLVSDFDLELEARPSASENVDYGLLYRFQDAENHYRFGVGTDGYYFIGVVRDGEMTPIRTWQQWPHVRRGDETNRLQIRCEGPICRFYINGEFTAEVTDNTFLEGRIGIWAESFSEHPLGVTWSGLRIWEID